MTTMDLHVSPLGQVEGDLDVKVTITDGVVTDAWTEAAMFRGFEIILRGKDKAIFTPHLDTGDFVVVVNAEKVKVTGKKETDKTYMSYSGWKGGEKYRTVAEMRERNPEKLIEKAVWGMLPKGRLGRQLITKLKVYKGDKHPHDAQQPETLTIAGAKRER